MTGITVQNNGGQPLTTHIGSQLPASSSHFVKKNKVFSSHFL